MLDHLRSLGCQDDAKIVMAYQTFLELTQIDHLVNVSCNYCASLDLIYLITEENSIKHIFVPIQSTSSVSPLWLSQIQNILNEKSKRIILVIRDGDSSSVRYELTDGLIPPLAISKRKLRSAVPMKKN